MFPDTLIRPRPSGKLLPERGSTTGGSTRFVSAAGAHGKAQLCNDNAESEKHDVSITSVVVLTSKSESAHGKPKAGSTETVMGFLAAIDTVAVLAEGPARIVIDGREGTIVAGGGIQMGPAVIHHQGVTLQIGGRALAVSDSTAARTGIVRVEARSSVQEVATGLHAAGVRPEDMAAIFESLRASGALVAEVVVR